MSKEEIIAKLNSLDLDTELRNLLIELVMQAQEVNGTLLNLVADVLELDADMKLQHAAAIDEEIEMYEDVALALEHLKAEYEAGKAEAAADEYEKALERVQQKVKELAGGSTQ